MPEAPPAADGARRRLDPFASLDMHIDEFEEKYVEPLEGMRTPTAAIDDYVKRPLTALVPDSAIYKFETGTGFEIRPVIQPERSGPAVEPTG